jgi:hypothetical protein
MYFSNPFLPFAQALFVSFFVAIGLEFRTRVFVCGPRGAPARYSDPLEARGGSGVSPGSRRQVFLGVGGVLFFF